MLLNREEINKIIDDKIDFYTKIYTDKEYAFLNFSDYDYNEMRYLRKLCKLDDINESTFNNIVIENVKNYIQESFNIDCHIYSENIYPKYSMHILVPGVDKHCCEIYLKNKTIEINAIFNQSEKYEKNLNRYKQDLQELFEVNEKTGRWIKDMSKNPVDYLVTMLYFLTHKKKVKEVHKRRYEEYQEDKINLAKQIKDYENEFQQGKAAFENYLPKLEQLTVYGYTINYPKSNENMEDE